MSTLTPGSAVRKLVFAINVSLDGFAGYTVAVADDELHDFVTGLLGNDTYYF